MKRARAQVDKIVDGSYKVLKYLRKYYIAVYRKSQKSKDYSSWAQVEYQQNMKTISNLASSYSWMVVHKNSIVSAQGPCMKKLQSQRSAGACYACSMRAGLFFTGDAINLNEKSCQTLISTCNQGWRYLITFLDKVNHFDAVVSTLKSKLQASLLKKLLVPSATSKISQWVQETELKWKLSQCNLGVSSFKVEKEICASFVTLEKPYYLQISLDLEPYKKPKTIPSHQGKLVNPFKRPALMVAPLKDNNKEPSRGPAAPTATTSAVSAQPATQSSPTTCTKSVCVSDVSIKEVSKCGSIGVMCAVPDMQISAE